MANSFWNYVTSLVAGTLAEAEPVNTSFDGIESGFTAVEAITDQAVKVTNSPGTVAIVLNAAARANKLLEFDVNGDIAATTIMGDWKGDHADAAGTDYQIRDVVKDAAGAVRTGNLYICTATHTSTGDLATDIANWDLLMESLATGGIVDNSDQAVLTLGADESATFAGTINIEGAGGTANYVFRPEYAGLFGAQVFSTTSFVDMATLTVELEASSYYEFEAQFIILGLAGSGVDAQWTLDFKDNGSILNGLSHAVHGGSVTVTQQVLYKGSFTAGDLDSTEVGVEYDSSDTTLIMIKGQARTTSGAETVVPQFRKGDAGEGSFTVRYGSFMRFNKITA